MKKELAAARKRIAKKNLIREAAGLPLLPTAMITPGPLVPPTPPRGRPTKFTPATTQRILQACAASISEDLIAEYGGISYSTMRDWIIRGELAGDDNPDAEERAFHEFSVQYKRARAEAEMIAITQIKAESQWTAKAWWLERRRPATYGRPIRLEHSGPNGGPMEFSDADLRERLMVLYAAMDGSDRGALPDVDVDPLQVTEGQRRTG